MLKKLQISSTAKAQFSFDLNMQYQVSDHVYYSRIFKQFVVRTNWVYFNQRSMNLTVSLIGQTLFLIN